MFIDPKIIPKDAQRAFFLGALLGLIFGYATFKTEAAHLEREIIYLKIKNATITYAINKIYNDVLEYQQRIKDNEIQ